MEIWGGLHSTADLHPPPSFFLKLQYSYVSVSCVQQSVPVMHIHVFIFIKDGYKMEYGALCYREETWFFKSIFTYSS